MLDVGAPPVWAGIGSCRSELQTEDVLRKDQMLVPDSGQFVARQFQYGTFSISDVSGSKPQDVWTGDNRGECTINGNSIPFQGTGPPQLVRMQFRHCATARAG